MNVLPDPVRVAARAQPDAPAIIGAAETVTYAELDRRVAAIADRLCALGLARGDRLAVYRASDADYLSLLLAAFRAGIVVVPLNTRQPAAAIPPLLDQIGCRTLVAALGAAWNGLHVVGLEVSGGALPEADADWQLDAPATIVFTSGSTGTPKAALHTLGNYVWSARGSVSFFDLQPTDRWLLNLPLYHVGGLAILFRCVLAGAAVVIPGEEISVEATVAAHGVTHASLVATQLLRVLHGDRADALAGMKAILLGGSAIPPGLLDDAYARGLPVHASYGMTEMASTVTATPPGATRAMLDTSGVVLPHRAVRLAADGEVLVRGDTLFAGYAEGDAAQQPTDSDGWFHTGDLGAWVHIDGAEALHVVGRKDNLFISGGENVQPEEVEAALGGLPGVRRAVVVPVANDEFGQRPVAFVEADMWAPEVWHEALVATLPRFKIPDAFHPWPDGIDADMKVSRARLRERAARISTKRGPAA